MNNYFIIVMRVFTGIDLYKNNTMRLHCVADVVYCPENREELRSCIMKTPEAVLLAAGSNLLLPANLRTPVISLLSIDNTLNVLDDGRVVVGCSVRIQELIRYLQKHNLGGIEYLYSVPASVGGLVYMNGGRGREWNMSISDYLNTVDYLDLDDMKIHTYEARKSDFTYRHSPFQEKKTVILSSTFSFRKQNADVTESLIRERLEYSKKYLSADKPSCGTVFCNGNRYIFRLLRGMRIGGAMFSRKTSNWISNVDNATYEDICKLIKRTQTIHRLCCSSCQPEIKIIKE